MTLQFSCAEDPDGGDVFYLSGKFIALDTSGEWFRDSGTNALYLWDPDSDSPSSHMVEAKARTYGFELSDRSYITIEGVNFFACSIDTNSNSTHNTIDGIQALYVSHFELASGTPGSTGQVCQLHQEDTGIIIRGSNNILQNSEIRYSAGNGVSLMGNNTSLSTGNVVTNCVIHDVDYMALDCSGVDAGIYANGPSSYAETSTYNTISYNTIYNSGRCCIRFGNLASGVIAHNNLYNAMLQTNDGGAMYAGMGNGKAFNSSNPATLIAYNRVHDIVSGLGGYSVGIYLDWGSTNYIIDHNLVYNVFDAINCPNNNNLVYNNTLIGSNSSVNCYDGVGGTYLENNIFGNAVTLGTNYTASNNLACTIDPLFVDKAALNFQLQSGSPAKDAGMVISSYTDGYIGSAPDIGAFEYGKTAWTAGAPTISIDNYSFESPDLPNASYVAGTAATGWTTIHVDGTESNYGAGYECNGSDYGAPTALEGEQAAMIKGAGGMYQDVGGFVEGQQYTISFYAAGRAGYGPNPFQVSIGGTTLTFSGSTTITPVNGVWNLYTATFTAAASETLRLQFLSTLTLQTNADVTSFIDSIRITEATSPAAPTNLVATAAVEPYITLSWTASSGEVSGYSIYRGTTAGGENSTPINSLIVGNAATGYTVSSATNLVAGGSFETPNLPNASYVAGTAATSWTTIHVDGTESNYGAGYECNGSDYGAPTALDGDQAAMIKGAGGMYQDVSGFVEGQQYTISFYAAGRAGYGPNPFQVSIGGTTLTFSGSTTITPVNGTWSLYTTTFTAANSGTLRLQFLSTLTLQTNADVTSFIESVNIVAYNANNTADNVIEYTDVDVTPGETYYYIIKAVNAAGASAASNEVHANCSLDTVTIAVATPSTTEGSGTDASFVVTRQGTYGDLTVNYTVSGSATAGSDYSALSGTVTILDGRTTALINVSTQINLVTNGSFESPNLAKASYMAGTAATSWTTIHIDGTESNYGAGYECNGSNYIAPTAMDGDQAAMIKGAGGMYQDVSGFVEGQQYTISFYAAGRTSYEPNPLQVSIGGTTLTFSDSTTITPINGVWSLYTTTFTAASSGTLRLQFLSTLTLQTNADVTSFIESVNIVAYDTDTTAELTENVIATLVAGTGYTVSSVTNLVVGSSFENPDLPNASYVAGTAATGWTTIHVDGTESNYGAGYECNGSDYGAPTALDGDQAAMIKGAGGMYQDVSGFVAGQQYTISFYAAGRAGYGASPFQVSVGGTTLTFSGSTTITPINGVWSLYTTTFTAASSGTLRLQFLSTLTLQTNADVTSFIENVRITAVGASAQITISDNDTLALPSSLKALWRLDENSGSTASDTADGTANNGTITGATWTTGEIGNALVFDGTSSRYVTVADTTDSELDMTSAMTVAVWVKSSTANFSGNDAFVSKANSYTFGPNGSRVIHFEVYIDGAYRTASYTIPDGVDLTQWHLYAATFNGATLQLYMDGEAVGTQTTYSGSISANDNAIYLGRSESNYFSGTLDEVRLYNAAVSAAAIASLYSQQELSVTGLTVSSSNWASYSVQSDLQVGSTQYGDTSDTFSTIPSKYLGSTYIRTANTDAATSENLLTFTVDEPVTIYILYNDSYTTKPDWLSDFTDTDDNIVTTLGTFSVYKKRVSAGTFTLGGNTPLVNGSGVYGMYGVLIVQTP